MKTLKELWEVLLGLNRSYQLSNELTYMLLIIIYVYRKSESVRKQ